MHLINLLSIFLLGVLWQMNLPGCVSRVLNETMPEIYITVDSRVQLSHRLYLAQVTILDMQVNCTDGSTPCGYGTLCCPSR